jgi:four helix bundle protein
MPKTPAKTFQDLIAWQKAHQFVLAVYHYTANFPESEKDGLTALCRRAATGVAAHIAEGFARKSKADKARYLTMAQAAVDESFYYLILAQDLGYGDNEALTEQLTEVRKLLADYTAVILTINFLASSFSR